MEARFHILFSFEKTVTLISGYVGSFLEDFRFCLSYRKNLITPLYVGRQFMHNSAGVQDIRQIQASLVWKAILSQVFYPTTHMSCNIVEYYFNN